MYGLRDAYGPDKLVADATWTYGWRLFTGWEYKQCTSLREKMAQGTARTRPKLTLGDKILLVGVGPANLLAEGAPVAEVRFIGG